MITPEQSRAFYEARGQVAGEDGEFRPFHPLNPTGEECARCGDFAEGYARYRGQRLCHSTERSCFDQTLNDA